MTSRTITDTGETIPMAAIRPGAGSGQPAAGGAERPAGAARASRAMISSLLWDVGPAVGTYYAARALGVTEYVALLAGTAAAAARMLWVIVRDRKVDAFAGFLLALFAVGAGLAFLTGDARFVLAKDSVTTGLAGLLFLGSCALRRPLAYVAAQRFAGPDGAAALRARTAVEPALRRRWYVVSLTWGAGMLGEALLRLPVIYLLPVDTAVGVSQGMQIAMFAGLTWWSLRWTRRNRPAS